IFDGVDLNYTPAAAGGPVSVSYRAQGKQPSDNNVWLYIAESNNETGDEIDSAQPGVISGQVSVPAGVTRYAHLAVEAPGTTEPWVASALTAPPGWGFELSDGTRTRSLVTDTDHWKAIGGYTFFEDIAGGFDSQAQAPISRGAMGGGAGATGYWNFDDTLDDQVGTNHASHPGTPTYSSDVPPAIGAGKSIQFDPADPDDYVEMPAAVVPDTGSFTIAGWVRSSASEGTFFDMSQGDKYFYSSYNPDELRWYFESANDADVQIGVPNTLTPDWHHVACIGQWDGNSHQLWVDGELVGTSGTGVDGNPGLNPLRVGKGITTSSYDPWVGGLDGKADDVAVWGFALSPFQIGDLYAGTLSPDEIAAPGGAYPADTESIWPADTAGGQFPIALFSAEFEMVPMAFVVDGEPASAPPGTPEGLNLHVVRSTSSASSVANAELALTMGPDGLMHVVSSLTEVDTAHLDGGGNIGGQEGNLAPTPNRDNYASHLAGYLLIPDADTDPDTPGVQYTHSFQSWSDDGIRMTVGDSVIFETDAWGDHGVVTVDFPEPGYWPIDVVWGQGGGGRGLEITARQGPQTSDDWNPFTWDILGSGDYPVYQRPDALPDASEVGANTMGGPITTTAPAAAGDGLHFRVTPPDEGGNINSIGAAINYLNMGNYVYDSTDPATGDAPIQVFNFSDGVGGPGGGVSHFGGNAPFPGLDPSTNNDDFATRARGFLWVEEPGTYSFGFTGDDRYRLQVNGQTITQRNGYSGDAAFAWVDFTERGFYRIEMIQAEDGGGASLEYSQGGAMIGSDPATRIPDLILGPGGWSNANTQGFDLDFDLDGNGSLDLYTYQPRARLERELLTLKGAAF
ncbi:MAG: LamG-like jellyroll fold domain-containing protein, partial [Candidatus Brocadiia bacterium]